MIHFLNRFLDAYENPNEKTFVRVISWLFWLFVLTGFTFCCMYFCYIFGDV